MSHTKGELSCPRDSFDICQLESGHVERGLLLTKSFTSPLVHLVHCTGFSRADLGDFSWQIAACLPSPEAS